MKGISPLNDREEAGDILASMDFSIKEINEFVGVR